MSKGAKGKAGYKYHMGLHLALCYGPVDKVTKITFDGRTAWEGISTGADIVADEPELFGADAREGGVGGIINVLMGGAAQPRNAYLQGVLGASIPAFRGVCSLVFNRFYIGNNPYLKKIAATLVRTDVQIDGSVQWYLAKADINGDMNPAHILREALVSRWGMGYNEALLDLTSLQGVADTLYAEGFGLSLAWREGVEIREFTQMILDHIHGVMRQHPTTGLISVKLLRDDYDIVYLPVFDESNIISMDDFQRRGWGETINEVIVVYHDRETNQDLPVPAQDLANIEVQGGRVISTTKQYPGISNAELAGRVAVRDKNLLAAPLSTRKFTINRTAFDLQKGDVFALNWPRDLVELVAFRVTNVNYGLLEDGRIQVECIEDYFSLPDNAYLAAEPSAWTNPRITPVAATYQRAYEATFWEVHNRVSAADIAALDPDFGFMVTQAVRPAGMYSYGIWSRVGAAAYASVGTGEFSPSCTFASIINQTDVTFTYANDEAMSVIEVGGVGYINDELNARGDEVVVVTAIDTALKTITFKRGMLDTVPQYHDAGARFWYAGNYQGFENIERVAGMTVDAKITPNSGAGELSVASATAVSVTFDNRYQRPYPPGLFKLNGNSYPSTTTGDIVITWAHRDRTLQTAYIVEQSEASIGPEPGTTYNVYIVDSDTDTVMHTETGITATTWTYTQVARIADFGGVGPHNVRVEMDAEVAGLVSWQVQRCGVVAGDL